MDIDEESASEGGTPLEAAIHQYLTSVEAGNSRKNFHSTLSTWQTWIRNERSVTHVEDLDILDCRRYARHLKQQTRNGDLKASTATTYYAYIRAFLSFCVADELIETNPAKSNRATDELPEDLGDTGQQFWREDDRRELFRFVDQQVERTLDEESSVEVSRKRAFRNRSIVYLLGLAGVRGGEVFSEPADEKRTGITWNDVEFETGAVRVLGKSREYEYAQLPEEAAQRLDRYKRVLEPPTDDWPVFPSAHAPSKYQAARDQLSEQGYSTDEIEMLLKETEIEVVLRNYEIVPPALTTNGARNVMKRLCEKAELEIDGEYLKPHGARRGLGHELYASGHAELAQSALRHASIETTHESYSDIQAAETAQQVGDVLGERSPSTQEDEGN